MVRLLLALLSISFLSPIYASTASIADFTRDMIHRPGLFDLYYHRTTGKVYLTVRDTRQPFLFQSSLPQGVGSNDIGLDRGQLGETRLVRFEHYGDKVLLKQLNTRFRAGSGNPAERTSVDEAFADSVIAGLPVVAQGGEQLLVDYTDFLLSDIHRIADRLTKTKQGTYKPDPQRSGVHLPRTKAFPDNTELEALVTFAGTKPGAYVKQVTPQPQSISVHLHHSLIRLPDDGYQPRRFHPYSGFWSLEHLDYAVPIEAPMAQRFIPRHRLQKRNPQAERSDPVEPIVYYLDPGLPPAIKQALRDGALWWDAAFAAIGYNNAFQVRDLPADADPMDVRYNVIQWVHRATRGWSYGTSVVDPRTGEIIKGHVTLGSLRVRHDYLIALGLTSPFSGENTVTETQKQMALARIRQLSAHEVGHTLGIAHNFAASENERASVMDYPHPLLSLQNGRVSLQNAYASGTGAWDNYVIAYGYQDYPDAEREQAGLLALMQQARDSGLAYQSDPDARGAGAANSQGHLWDNGADPLAELQRLFDIRRVALANFGINSIPAGTPLANLEESLAPIYLLHRYQAEAVAKLVGGVTYQYELKGDYPSPQGIQVVAPERQLQAVDALISIVSPEFLAIPEPLQQLIVPKAYGDKRTRESFHSRSGITFDPVSAGEAAAGHALSLLLQPQRLNRVAQQHSVDAAQPGVAILVERLLEQTLKSGGGRKSPAHPLKYRLDHVVLNALVQLLERNTLAPEVKAAVYYRLMQLPRWLKKDSRNPQKAAMAQQLEIYFESGKWKGEFEVLKLPPGSPI
ncbi:DUF5117 domain-containing protein [Exilibacterium tricleocarpae]|uniref:DUF5117 domain-containing protein n=1 Tax=Exilibacterium tricleocarpae TaxID=2591008 RepID=A0A545SNF1_9GAMM|nr:zinc-dependent metalloprotease [Exilibacterium tricleocarpae]TQV66520.1 DUF5117 domain-containing protein [Exilibacterium tricleocarpae]